MSNDYCGALWLFEYASHKTEEGKRKTEGNVTEEVTGVETSERNINYPQ